MNFFTREIKIGITAILAVAIIYGGMVFLKGMNVFENDNIYYLRMKNVSGLAPQNEVMMCGMKIGQVLTIDYQPATHDLLVKIEVEEGFAIAEGSTASLAKEMLGTTKVSINMPDNAKGFLAKGDTIAGKDTPDLMDAAANLVPQFQAMLPKLDSILTSINTLAANPALNNSLNNIEVLTKDLHTTTVRINGLLGKEVPQLLSKADVICTNLQGVSANLNAVNFNELADNVNSTMTEMQLFTNRLNNENSSLGMLLKDDAMYNNLNSTFANASLLLEDFRLHPKRYVHFSLFGKKDK